MRTQTTSLETTDSDAADEGGYPVPRDVFAWVHKQIARGAAMIVLRQRADEGEMLIASWTLPGAGAEAVAIEIDQRAHSEGRFLRGPTLFLLYAFLESGREHVDRKSLRIEGETFRASGETEPPNMHGITSMLMRHAEGATKIALGHTSHIIEQYKAMLAGANRRVADLETELGESARLRQSLITAEHERQLEEHRLRQEDKRNEFMMGQLKLLMPAVAKRFFGTGVGGAEATDALISQFMSSLKPEQLSQIASVLTPAQQTVLGEMYIHHAQRSENASAAAAASAPNGQPQTAPERTS
ncbi:hypothetical protein EON77_06475 [bacterium]|nr:MAG: hypothetical protein EON77_06475 [bacterium]